MEKGLPGYSKESRNNFILDQSNYYQCLGDVDTRFSRYQINAVVIS
jgi:hypothetical protein